MSSAGETTSSRQRLGPGALRALHAVFNVIALNIVWVVASLPLVTIPLATAAAFTAIDSWLSGTDDRVLHSFACRARHRPVRTSVLCGLPMCMLGIAVLEISYFAPRPLPVDRMCLGIALSFGIAAAAITGYVLLVVAKIGAPGPVVWKMASALCPSNLLVTGPLLVLQVFGGIILGYADPGLVAVVVPASVMFLVYQTTSFGLRRVLRRQARALPGTRLHPADDEMSLLRKPGWARVSGSSSASVLTGEDYARSHW